MNSLNVVAFGLRGGAALAKLLFVTYLGFYSYEELLGRFAFFTTIVVVFTQIAGLEINQTIGRRLHALDEMEKVQLFQSQAIASILSYILLSTLIVVLHPELLGSYWIIGIIILMLEHYTTELYRLYILKLKSLKAASILFVKNFGWVLLFVALHQLNFIEANIENVLVIWLIFLLVALAMGSPSIGEIYGSLKYFESEDWLKNTWNVVWPSRFFMLSAMVVAGIGAMDKFLIGVSFSLEQLGNYYFFQTIASIPALIISFSLGATLWPKCIQLASTGKHREYEALWTKMNSLYVLVSVSLSVAISIGMPFVLGLLGKSNKEINLLYILMASSSIFVLCDPYKLNLYTQKNDLGLLIGSAIQLILVITCIAVSLSFNTLSVVALSLFLANLMSWLAYRFKVPGRIAQLVSGE